MRPIFSRDVDDATDGYRFGLLLGLIDIGMGIYGTPEALSLGICDPEGYRDAIDDSDDMPEPFDPEETFVP